MMMTEQKDQNLFSRKKFLKTSAGLLTFGFLGSKGFGRSHRSIPKVELGKTGIKVTPIAMGASRTQEPAIIQSVLEQGINFLDTGRSYANGQNEVMLGEALKGKRKDLVIQSKMRVRMRETGEALLTSKAADKIKKQMTHSLDASLKALQTDYIDIMLFHLAKTEELLFHEAVLAFFSDAKKSGKIRAYGFSLHNENMHILKTAIEKPFYEIVMVPYNFKGAYIHSLSGNPSEWDQDQLESYLKKLYAQNVGIIAMKTCSGGKTAIKSGQAPTYTDAIRWVLNQPFVDCAAVAMLDYDQMKEDLAAMP